MSIILDALKKSESDQQRHSGPALFEVKVAPPKARFPVWAIAIVALLVINMLIVGYMLLRRSSHTDETVAANMSAGGANPSAAQSNGQNGTAFNNGPANGAYNANGGAGYPNGFGGNGMPPNGGQGFNTSGGPYGANGPAQQGGGPYGSPNQRGGTNAPMGPDGGGNSFAGQGGGANGSRLGANSFAGQSGGANDSRLGANSFAGQEGGRNWPGAQGANWGAAQGAPASGQNGSSPPDMSERGSGEPTLANRAHQAVGAENGQAGNPDDEAPAADPGSPLFKGHVKRGTESGLPLYQDIAVVPGVNLPQLRLDLHVYAAKPEDRFALINMKKMHEGDSLAQGVRVESITPDGVILSQNGTKFLLPRE